MYTIALVSVLLENLTASSDHRKYNIMFAETFKTTLVSTYNNSSILFSWRSTAEAGIDVKIQGTPPNLIPRRIIVIFFFFFFSSITRKVPDGHIISYKLGMSELQCIIL